MTGEGAVEVVTRLYGAAHWRLGESDYTLWHEALADIPDDEALAAAVEMIGHIDPNEVRYTPALLRQTVNIARAKVRGERPTIPEAAGPVASKESSIEWARRLKAQVAAARGPLARGLRGTIRTPNEADFDESGELRL